MKKKNLYIGALVLGLCLTSTTFTSCSDPEDTQDLVLARVLSPTGITARISNNTDIVVNWNATDGASSYEIEAYADNNDYENSTPAVTATTTSTTYTLTNLIGETDYYVRVRAIDGENEARNSKWVEIMRTTNPEQNMNKVKSADIQGKAVKVTWTPGLQVDKVVCTPSTAGSTAPTVSHELTTDEIAAGSAIVTGLTPETSYKVTLKLGEKTRGFASFTTNIDFSDAIVVSPTDDWVSTIQNAAAGTKIALAPGTYSLTNAKLQIKSNVKIGAQNSGDLPVLNTCIHVNNEASLMLYQVVLDGTGTDGSQAIEYKTSGSFGDLTIKGCEVRNYTKGFIYINTAAVVNEIDIDNTLVHDIECSGGDLIDSRKGGWNNLNITNSTFYNSAAKRDILRADDASSSVNANMETLIDKCTFYNVGNGNANYRFFYIRFKGNSNTFTNNIVANFNNKRGFANSSSVAAPTYSNNYYFNCKNLTELAEGNTETCTHFDTTGTVLSANPFKDADNGDFTIVDEELQSKMFGDPRWY